MPLIINKASGVTMGTADKDYFLDSEGKVTTSEEKAATLLIRKGQDIPKEMAEKYAIGKPAEKPAKTDGDGKKAAAPSKNKSDKPAENK